uniref:Uncharacterized protein n=1 Tax=viral metagenome TaxID=1070528 RepID=A0A6C0BPZ6_9ZZZZ
MSSPRKRKSHSRKGHSRKAYTRKDGVRVRACRVKPTTVRAAVVRLPPAKPGQLRKYGYSLSANAEKRLAALSRGVRQDGYATIMRRLNWLAVMNKSRPKLYRKVKIDMNVLKKKFQSK